MPHLEQQVSALEQTLRDKAEATCLYRYEEDTAKADTYYEAAGLVRARDQQLYALLQRWKRIATRNRSVIRRRVYTECLEDLYLLLQGKEGAP